MKIVQQQTYKIEYKNTSVSYNDYSSLLVEADSFEEALKIFKEYTENNNKLNISSITKYTTILKPLTKTITVEI